MTQPIFVYSKYWGKWSRLLKTNEGESGFAKYIEVNLTPINPSFSQSWEEQIIPIVLRTHCTQREKGEGPFVTLPPEVVSKMVDKLGVELTERLISSDLMSEIDEDLLMKRMRGGGIPLARCRKMVPMSIRQVHPLDYPISQLRFVKMSIVNREGPDRVPHDQVHMMHESQVETFVAATIKLHHTEGNPHLPVMGTPPLKLDNLWEIRTTSVAINTTSYWWCVPDLQKNNDPKGAQLNLDTFYRRVWAHSELLELEKRARAEEEQDEYEMDMEIGPYAPRIS